MIDLNKTKAKFDKLFEETSEEDFFQMVILFRLQEIDQIRKQRHMVHIRNMGILIGHILWQSMPTLSINQPKSWNVIQISDQDYTKFKEIEDTWFNTQTKENWIALRTYDEELDAKYLPTIYSKKIEIKIKKSHALLDGIISFLWNCDGCTYSLDKEDFEFSDVPFGTLITMKWKSQPIIFS